MNKGILIIALICLSSFRTTRMTNFPFAEVSGVKIYWIYESKLNNCPCEFYTRDTSHINSNQSKNGILLEFTARTFRFNRKQKKVYGMDYGSGAQGISNRIKSIQLFAISKDFHVDISSMLKAEEEYIDNTKGLYNNYPASESTISCYYKDSIDNYRFYRSTSGIDNAQVIEAKTINGVFFTRPIDNVKRINGNDNAVSYFDRFFFKHVNKNLDTLTNLINENAFTSKGSTKFSATFLIDNLQNYRNVNRFELKILFEDGAEIKEEILNCP